MNSKEPRIPPFTVIGTFRRRLQFPGLQLVGVALLLAVPILAVLGVFGPCSDTVAETMPGLEMQVKYPTRFRYQMFSTLEVSLENTSNRSPGPITVTFDRNYISRFSQVQFTPSVKSVTATDYRVQVDIPPGEIRRISVSLQADRYGIHDGSVGARVNGASILVPVSTFVFP